MSDAVAAALIAALITVAGSALVAAGTMIAGEILRGCRERKAAIGLRMSDVLDELDSMTRDLGKPLVMMRWSTKPLTYMSSFLRLFSVLPKRDLVMIDWLMARVNGLGGDRDSVAEVIGSTESILMLWMRSPKTARRTMHADLERDGKPKTMSTLYSRRRS